jgi:hypothetical protein
VVKEKKFSNGKNPSNGEHFSNGKKKNFSSERPCLFLFSVQPKQTTISRSADQLIRRHVRARPLLAWR